MVKMERIKWRNFIICPSQNTIRLKKVLQTAINKRNKFNRKIDKKIEQKRCFFGHKKLIFYILEFYHLNFFYEFFLFFFNNSYDTKQFY